MATAELEARLKGHSEYFNTLLSRIDPKYYFPVENDGDSGTASNKFAKHKKNQAQIPKEALHKFKQLRFDPDQAKTVVDIQRERVAQQKEAEAAAKVTVADGASVTKGRGQPSGKAVGPASKTSKRNLAAAPTSSRGSDASSDAGASDSADDSVGSRGAGAAKTNADLASTSAISKADAARLVSGRPASALPREQFGTDASTGELRAKLDSKVQAMRDHRHAADMTPEEKAEYRRKRKEEKAERRKAQKKARETGVLSTGASTVSKGGDFHSKASSHGPVAGKTVHEPKQTQLRFSKVEFDGSRSSLSSFSGKAAKTAAGKKQSKPDKHGLLKKLEAQQAKLAKLKETNKEKASAIEDKVAWGAALQRAEGLKVKDDPNALRKVIKRDQKRKAKSQREWTDRVEKVQAAQAQRQKKRAENIRDRQSKKSGQKSKGSKAGKGKTKGKGKGRPIPTV